MHTGDNIRKTREAREISRETLAEEIGQDKDYIRQMEEENLEAPVSILLKIASALDTDISALIYGKEFEEKSVMVTNKDSRIKVERKKAFDYENLAPYYSGRHMEPFLVDVYPVESDDRLEYSSHVGEEFHYVMEGRLRILVGEEEHILNPGDSVYFDSSLPHALASLDKKTKL